MQFVSDTTNASETWLDKVLPILRAKRTRELFYFGSDQKIVALFKDKIVLGRTRKPLPIGDAGASSDELERQLCGQLRRDRVIPLQSVYNVAVERPRLLSPNVCRFRLTSPAGALRFALFRRDVGNFLHALQELLGDRFVLDRGAKIHTWAALAVVVFLLLAMGVGLPFAVSNPWAAAVIGCLFPLLLLVLVYVVFSLPGKQLELNAPAPKPRRQRDKSHRSPFRSRILGWTMKALAAVWLLAPWLFRTPIAMLAAPPWLIGVMAILWLTSPLALILLYLGYLLSQKRPDYVRKNDTRPPILYLRSFLDDRKTDLQTQSLVAELLGTQPSSSFPRPWRYILLAHPIRILRLLFGIAVDTSEEQLGAYFRKFGPFVAIGKPGEHFATSGASRMYVSNETWQQTVIDLLAESQIVVLQPAKTEGIWWEVQKTIAAVEPQRLLLCLVNFYRRQDDYETFRLKIEEYLSRPLPRWLGYTAAPCFLYFDPDWTPRVSTLSYRSPLVWPIIGSTPDLAYTLKPFQRRLATGEAGSPLPRRRYWGHGLLAVCLYVFLPFLFTFLIRYMEARSQVAAAVDRLTGAASHALGKTTYRGKALDYRITLDDAWKKLPDQPNRDRAFMLGDKAELEIRVDPKMEDLSGLRETYAKNVRTNPGVHVALSESRQVAVDGREWSEFTAKVDGPSKSVHARIRSYAGDEGTFIAEATFLRPDDEAERQVAEALASFVLPKGREIITLPDGKRIYTGRATPYHITLDRAWVQRPEGAANDLHFVIGDKQELMIMASPKQEDLSKLPDQYTDGVRKGLKDKGLKAEVKLLRNKLIRLRGKEWTDLLVELKLPEKIKYQRLRIYSGSEGTYVLILTSSGENADVDDLAVQTLDSFELPALPEGTKAGK